MKLQIYNKANSSLVREPNAPTVRVAVKNGLFTLNGTATALLGLKDKDGVIISADTDRPKDWYIAKVNAPEGFVGRLKDDKKSFNVNCVKATTAMAKSVGINTACSFTIAPKPTLVDGVEWYAILTVNKLNEK